MATYPIRTRRWTRKEYDRLIDLGILHEDEPIELVGGQMIVAEPKSSPHETALGLTADALRRGPGGRSPPPPRGRSPGGFRRHVSGHRAPPAGRPPGAPREPGH